MIAYTGSIASRMLADQVGLVEQLSIAMARRSFVPAHDRCQLLTNVSVMLTDGGEAIFNINVLRYRPGYSDQWLRRRRYGSAR